MSPEILFAALSSVLLGLVAWWLFRPAARAGRRALTLGGSALVLGLGVLLYLTLGEPRALDPAARAPAPPTLAALVAELETRMAERPDDVQGWLMLGRSQLALGRPVDAQAAYQRARELSGDRDPVALAGYAEARLFEDPARLTTEVADLFARVRALSPDDVKGLFYGALAAAEVGDTAAALAMFDRLLALDPPEELRRAIAARRAALTGTAADFAVTVELDPDITPAADASLFVYLRRPGQPMPLAARRLAIAAFPAELRLGPDDALAGQQVPTDEPLIVGARLGRAATRASGEPFGEVEVVAGRRSARVRIAARVP